MNINLLLRQNSINCWQTCIPTKSKEFYISILAGQGQYSDPREKLLKAEYKLFEIAIFNKNGKVVMDSEIEELLKPIFPDVVEFEITIGYATQEQIWACVDAL